MERFEVNKQKVLVLGANGMIGRAVFRELRSKDFDVFGTTRNVNNFESEIRHKSVTFEANNVSHENLKNLFSRFDVIVNTLGLIKQNINELENESRLLAIKLNALLPSLIASSIEGSEKRVIQIATDCVFTGAIGKYTESSHHDAYDIYGKSKSLGEVEAKNFLNLRCSVVGTEKKDGKGLLNWVIQQRPSAQISGFLNHYWNGLTSKVFAEIVVAEIVSHTLPSGTFHLVPEDQVSKAELVRLIADKFNREDLVIQDCDAPTAIDRTLTTEFPEINRKLWENAGYFEIPKIKQMIANLPFE